MLWSSALQLTMRLSMLCSIALLLSARFSAGLSRFWNVASPQGRHILLAHPDKTHRSTTIVIDVSLLHGMEIEDVAVYRRLFAVKLKRPCARFMPVPCVTGTWHAAIAYVIEAP